MVQYDAVDVTGLIEVAPPGDDAGTDYLPWPTGPEAPSGTARVFAFRGRAAHRTSDPARAAVVPARYRELVEAAVATRGPAFVEEFEVTMLPPTGPEKHGGYRFMDPDQESATRPE